MATLTKIQLDQIRAALLPFIQTPESREALVRAALWGKPALDRLKWDQTASAFSVQLAEVLDNTDLADVLKEASTQVGTDGQAKLMQLAAQITAPVPNEAGAKPLPSEGNLPSRVKLRDALVDLFSVGDLETLCFDFGISADKIEGHNDTITKFANGIVQWFEQRSRLAELAAYVRRERPNADV